MTDSPAAADTAPVVDPGPPPPPPAGRPGGWDRFFAWVAGLGIARSDGWLGGVCAGIAARLGIDPIIVRGVFVVAALFGLPMFIMYAIGWALLPDLANRVHLRELIAQRFDPAMVGIGLMLLLGLFPVIPWFFAAVTPFGFPGVWFDWSPWGFFATLLAVTVIAGVIILIARSSSRAASSGAPETDPRTASADASATGEPAQDASGVRAPADPTPGAAPAASGAVGSALTPPADPAVAPAEPAAPVTAGDAEMAAWREQHEAWRQQDAAWRRQQQDAERAARDQARAERAATGAAFAAEAAERRRIRRASNPRTSFGYVVFVIGAALVVGATTSLWRGSAEGGDPVIAVAFGLFASALVVAIAMIVAGAVRRRSGFLAFLAIVLLVAGSITAAFPVTRGIVFGTADVNSYDPQSFTQLWGDLNIFATPTGSQPEAIVIEKRRGDTYIYVDPGIALDLRAVSPGAVEWTRWDWSTGEQVDDGALSGQPTADGRILIEQTIDNVTGPNSAEFAQVVELDQLSGTVHITFNQH